MNKHSFKNALCALPVLAAFGCSNTPAEPNPPSPTVKTPSAETKMELGDFASFQRVKGDFLPTALKMPAKLVKGSYGTGAVYRWAEVDKADMHKIVPSYLTELHKSHMFFAPESVKADGNHELSVPVDSASETKIYVVPRTSPGFAKTLKLADLKLDMVQPSGIKLLASSPDVHLLEFEGADEEVAPLVGSKFQTIRLEKPSVGVHTIKFTPPAGVEHVGAIVLADHGLDLGVTIDRHSVVAGEPVIVRAKLTPGEGQTVATGVVKAKVMSKTGATFTTVTLHDDGIGADKVAGDMEFAGEFVPTSDDMNDVGFWTTMVEARGTTAEGAPYLRHASSGVGVALPIAKFTGKIAERRGEVEGTSCFQFLVNIETAVAGRYRVRGIVTTPSGDALVETSTAIDLPVGAGRVALAVPLKALEGKGSSFKLADLQLVSMDTEFPVARIADAYVTKSSFTK